MRIVLELIREPPQKGRVLPVGTSATCQGNSPGTASTPPTILDTPDTPHGQSDIVDGVVVAGTVELFVVVAGAVEFVVDAGQTVPVNCVWIHPTAVETRANPPG